MLSVNASEKVQQKCAATASASSDPKRSVKTSDLRQRPPPTSMQLVHTEEVASYRMRGGITGEVLPLADRCALAAPLEHLPSPRAPAVSSVLRCGTIPSKDRFRRAFTRTIGYHARPSTVSSQIP